MDKINNNYIRNDLYKEIPSNYDLSTWANKIQNEKKAHMSIFNLKKMVNGTDSKS